MRFAKVAQSVEHAAENRGVGSSILPLGTIRPVLRLKRGSFIAPVNNGSPETRASDEQNERWSCPASPRVSSAVVALSEESTSFPNGWPRSSSPVGVSNPCTWRRLGSRQATPLRVIGSPRSPSCNGGWMSGLENQVKPILWPLVEARPTTGLLQPLRRPDCVLLARWAAKTAVTFHYARRKVEMQELSSAMLSWLPAHDDPPRNTVVWAGRYIGSRLVVVNEVFAKLEAETVSGLPLVGGLSGTALVTTMAIGKIAFQVFAFKGRGMGTVATPPAWSRSLVKLWPYDGQSLTWPPREALDDTGLEGLNARFGSALALGGMPQPKIPS
jgi:hypothetical protein